VALTSPVLSAIQTAGQMKSAASQTSDGRMQALAGAVTALSAKNAYDAVSSNPSEAGGVNVSVSMGVSKSDSKTMQTSTTAVGSVVSAGGNVSIQATGAGKDSDVSIQGSTVKAGGNVTLKADDEIKMLAAKNTAEQHSTNTSSSASVGVSVGTSGLLYTVSASGARGNADGSDVTWTNTHVDAGNTLTMQSGGDTTLKGAVATGASVVARAGGDLHIESLQDTSVYDSKQKSLGGSVSAGAGVISGSINVGNSKIQSDYASVTEQSGIKAGDKGFQVSVAGNTNLIGAVIASTDAAATAGENALSTATLTQTALQNKANYSAQSVSLGGGYSTSGGGVGKDQKGNAESGGSQTPGSTLPSLNGFSATTPVAMAASGNASSVTQSGISGGAVTITDSTAQLALTGQTSTQAIADVKRDVATGKDGSNALAPVFNKQEIEAGFAVVSALTREVGTFIETRAREVDVKNSAADKAEQAAQDPNSGLSDAARLALIDQAIALRGDAQTISADWGAGGTYRQITTALVAAAGGNVTGSSGAMVQGMVVNYVQQQGAGYIGQLVANGTVIEGSAEHAALHAIVACGGAAAGGSHCASGAGGAGVSSLLTGLFSETSPDETQAQREAKRNLITSLVGGIAATTGADVATATGAGIAATDNNWLASQQIVQRNKELAAAKGPLETMSVMAKWAGVSGKQDALTLNGVAKGLAEAGWTDVKGIATFLSNPVEGLNGLKELLSSSDARAQLGYSVVNSLKGKIDRMNFALVQGGDQNAEKLGKELGEVIWQVGSVLTGAGAVAKGGVALAKAGVNVGSTTLKAMAATSTAVITEIKIASALPGAAKSVEELAAQTGAGLKSQYAAKPGNAYTVKAQAGNTNPAASHQFELEPVTGTNAISESAINPALAARLDLYKKWKADNEVVGTPSLKEFQLFDDPSRVQSRFKNYANSEWPPHSGALDGNSPFILLPGAQVDRFGSDFGSYLSPTGTTYAERALRPGTQNSPYSVFEVTSHLDVEVATIRPWFGEIGMGTQFKLLGDTRVKNLLESGQLKEIYRGPYNGYKH